MRAIQYLIPLKLDVFRRFGPTLFFCVISTGYWIALLYDLVELEQSMLLFAVLFLGAFLFLPVSLWSELRDGQVSVDPQRRWIEQSLLVAAVLLILIGYYFGLAGRSEIQQMIYFYVIFAISVATALLLPMLPIFRAGSEDGADRAEESEGALLLLRLSRNFFFAILNGGILYIGLAIALAAVMHLFDLTGNRFENLFLAIWYLLAGIYAPLYFLSLYPQTSELPLNREGVSSWERLLFLYIFSPLSLLYFVILTLYALTIIFTWSLPKGGIVYMVVAFSLVAFVVRLVLDPFRDESRLHRLLHAVLYPWNLAIMPLLFVAITIRLLDYGITEQRYFVVLAAIWITAIALHGIVRRHGHYRFALASAILLLSITLLGPIGAIGLSDRSQLSRLESMLAEVRADGGVAAISAERRAMVREQIQYLQERGTISLEREELALFLDDTLEIEQLFEPHERGSSFRIGSNLRPGVGIAISGYDWYSSHTIFQSHFGSSFALGGGLQMSFDEKGEVVIFRSRLAQPLARFSLSAGWREELRRSTTPTGRLSLPVVVLGEEHELLEFESDGVRLKIHVRDLWGEYLDGELKINSTGVDVFISTVR